MASAIRFLASSSAARCPLAVGRHLRRVFGVALADKVAELDREGGAASAGNPQEVGHPFVFTDVLEGRVGSVTLDVASQGKPCGCVLGLGVEAAELPSDFEDLGYRTRLNDLLVCGAVSDR